MGKLYEVYTELQKLLQERNQFKTEVEILEKQKADLKAGMKILNDTLLKTHEAAGMNLKYYFAERREREMLQEQMAQMSHQIDLYKERNRELAEDLHHERWVRGVEIHE